MELAKVAPVDAKVTTSPLMTLADKLTLAISVLSYSLLAATAVINNGALVIFAVAVAEVMPARV